MKHVLTSGAEIELVSPDELRTILGETFPSRKGPQTERMLNGLKVDASGNGTVVLWQVPAGMEFELHSLLITADGKSPASRMATGYAYLQAGGALGDVLDVFDFTLTGAGVPIRHTYGSDAPLYHEREVVCVCFFGITASTNVVVRGQGVLAPLIGVA